MSYKLRSKIAKLINKPSHKRFVEACANPVAAQNQVWEETRALLMQSDFWRQRGLTSTSTLEEFPITTYSDYAETLLASFGSDRSPLTGEKLEFWCQSSGTTARKKIFPLTKTYVRQIRRTATPFIYEMMQNRPEFLAGKTMFFAASALNQKSPGGVDVGFISHYSYRNLPKIMRRHYTFPLELLQDSSIFDEWAPYYALCSDVAGIIAVTPGMITNLVKTGVNRRHEFLAIMKGEAPFPANLPRPKVSAERIALLEEALNDRDVRLKKIWPRLSMITTWKSSTAGWQMKDLEAFLTPDVLVTDGQYSATEGWMGVPYVSEKIGSRFHPGAVVVEFLEYGREAKAANLLKPWELKEGGLYEVFLTTTMGLIRYRIFDVVKCLGFDLQSPILSFQYKADNSVSLGQTRFSEINLLEAIQKVGFEARTPWVIAPDASGRRMVFVAQEDDPQLRQKVRELDSVWAQVNPEIQSDYDSQLLLPMEFRSVGREHAIWATPKHAQSKTQLISKVPIT